MIEISYGPEWFYLVSIFIDLISIVVLFMISSTAFRYYKLNNNKNYAKLGFAFLLIAISFLFKMITNVTVYYDSLMAEQITETVVRTIQTIRSYNILANLSFALFVLANLAGVYGLYSIRRGQQRSTVSLIIYFILISTFVSSFLGSSAYYLFHLTSLIFLIFIASRYYNLYTKNHHKPTRYLAAGFSILAISQAFFMFITLNPLYYVVAELIQVIGYVLLLNVLILVLYYGKKKKQD
jgi:hypothetical protein